jgi:hypothetical protein
MTPQWKLVACMTCDALPGQSCGRRKLGAPAIWQRAAPHASRKKLAGIPAAGISRESTTVRATSKDAASD